MLRTSPSFEQFHVMLRTSLFSYLALKQGDQTTSHRRPHHVVCTWVCAYHVHVPCVGHETFLSQAFHTLHTLSLQPLLTSLKIHQLFHKLWHRLTTNRVVVMCLALPHCVCLFGVSTHTIFGSFSLTRMSPPMMAITFLNWQCKLIASIHFTSSSFCYHCLFSTHSNYFLTLHSLHIIHRHILPSHVQPGGHTPHTLHTYGLIST